MVGDPKHLSDLSRIEAAVAVRCRSCGHRRVFDRDLLTEYLRIHGGVPAWSALALAIPCRCGSADLSLAPMPYTREVRDPEQRRHHRALIELAVAVLDDSDRGRRADTLPVRLALRVLMPHVANRGTLVSLWQAAQTDNPLVRSTGYDAGVASVRLQLRMMGRL